MPDFVPNDRHLREVLIFFFHSKKTTAEACRELQKVYGNATSGETTCRDWFRLFKDGDSDVDDRLREGRSKTFEDAELEAFLDKVRCQSQEERLAQREGSHGECPVMLLHRQLSRIFRLRRLCCVFDGTR